MCSAHEGELKRDRGDPESNGLDLITEMVLLPLTLPGCGTYLQGDNGVDVHGDSSGVYPAHCRDQRIQDSRATNYKFSNNQITK